MTSLLRKLFSSPSSTNRGQNDEEYEVVNLSESDKPYILTEIYYLFVIFFIGIPMWFLTCSSSRYSLPQTNVELIKPRSHLDISVVHLISAQTDLHIDDPNYYENLRGLLQNQLNSLDVSNQTYITDWRVRRPTSVEIRLFKSLIENKNDTPLSPEQARNFIENFEKGLQDLHKQSYKFRLLIFILDKKFCNGQNTYIFGSEPFVFLCPTNQNELVSLVKSALWDTYLNAINLNHIKRNLSSRTNLQVTIVHDKTNNNVQELSKLADKFHEIYHENVKNKFMELPAIFNIRFITQHLYDSPFDSVEKMLNTRSGIEEFFRYFMSRIDEPLENDVRHVAAIISTEISNSTNKNFELVETPDSHFVMQVKAEQSIYNGLKAIVRRVIGLKSTTLCQNCLFANKQVFLNKWELDVLITTLTALKLQSVYISIESLGKLKQIPKLVSIRANEAHEYALKALGELDSRRPMEAYRFASSSYELAEKAYYDPSLVDTSNEFPEENKYAVYLPLFLPLAIPILASLLRVLRYFYTRSESIKRKIE